MSFGGRLETLDLSALLQTLSVGVASGRLTLTRLDRHAVLVLRERARRLRLGRLRRRRPSPAGCCGRSSSARRT